MRMPPEDVPAPSFDEAWDSLPVPIWEGHAGTIDCYRKVWELAFANVRRPEPGSGFVSNFIDTAFNDCLFMWDSAFILLFARYGRRAFDFQRTLDNLYASQHPDGFICREIGTLDGRDRFERFDATSTGPNVMPWTEWEHYGDTADRGRLARVFPALVSYHRWLRRHRTWRDGTYWTSGLGSGMDNQPRFPERPAAKTGGTSGSISRGPPSSACSAAARRSSVPASGGTSPAVRNCASTRAARALAFSGRASAPRTLRGICPRTNTENKVRKTGHRSVGTVARRGSATRCLTMGTVLASRCRIAPSKSIRPRALRSTGVMSKKTRPADSVKKAAPP